MNCENFLSEASSDRIRDVSLAMTRRCGETKKASDQMCWKHIMCADEGTNVRHCTSTRKNIFGLAIITDACYQNSL